MLNHRENAINYFNQNKNEYIGHFKELLKIPSISADSTHKDDLYKAAKWIVKYLRSIGIEKTDIFDTKLHPIVFGEYLKAGKEKPTVLIYGHYDVQPPDPISLWQSDPFSPIEKDGLLFARGASDMKGQLMASLSAIDAIMHTDDFPVNLKFIIEGEEEIGSPSIVEFLETHRELLKSDFAFNMDAGMIAADVPTIVYGLRGLAYFEIHVKGPEHDLHSGLFGGIVYNPAQALCEILAGMKDKNGKILLPNYYEDIEPLSSEERTELSNLPMNDQYYLDQTGVPELWGEGGYTASERVGGRPTLEINGILSGYTGEGPKTVIPSWAMVKISSRLVPNQTPEKVHQQLLEYMQSHAPKNITWEVKPLTSDFPCVIGRDFYATKCFSDALESVWKKQPVYKREGGSIPIVSYMKSILGTESVLSGFGLPDDRIHSPNERINLELWHKGVQAIIHFFYNLSESRM
jgi:acetylornithine deacetylase/succinyl-diaminopimelate desuccinylase-like protein